MRSQRVEIRIEQIVAHGFESHDARDIADALRAALVRTFAEGLRSRVARHVDYLDAGIVRSTPRARTEAIATAAAGAIRTAVAPNRGPR